MTREQASEQGGAAAAGNPEKEKETAQKIAEGGGAGTAGFAGDRGCHALGGERGQSLEDSLLKQTASGPLGRARQVLYVCVCILTYADVC
jgi:hypothetical protein